MASGTKKFIPNGDLDFSEMAWRFAHGVANDPEKYQIDQDDAEALAGAVARFREALSKARGGGRRSASPAETSAKDAARAEAEKIIRRVAGAIRSNDRVEAAHKAMLGIKVAGARRRSAKVPRCPQESPRLHFEQAIHRSVHVPEHELTFWGVACEGRPAGAARLELFAELVPPEDAVPKRPGDSRYGVHYLRSYVRSPIRLVPPMAERPMRVVYWGRWADASGDVGPFSAAAVGWVEGGSHHLMGPAVPGASLGGLAPGEERPKMIEVGEPGAQQMRVMVAVMQAQRRYLEGPRAVDAQALAGDADSTGIKQLNGPPPEPPPEALPQTPAGDWNGEAEDGAEIKHLSQS
jgi:hypothetical protein